jgi:hypothetical protein
MLTLMDHLAEKGGQIIDEENILIITGRKEVTLTRYDADRRNSWQMWENFAEVAMDISNFGQVWPNVFLDAVDHVDWSTQTFQNF